MSSEVKANKLSPATGTALQISDSGDTTTIPSGATLAIASGATIDLTGATKTGFPAGGLTHASAWRLTTSFAGAADPIASNLEVNDTSGYGSLGAAMTESSGVFTFPATGYWLIRANGEFYLGSSNSRYNILQIKTTVNNGVAWTETGGSMQMVPDSASGHYGSTSNMFLFDVTDTANCKVSFRSGPQNAATATQGSSTADSTYFTFVRLADT